MNAEHAPAGVSANAKRQRRFASKMANLGKRKMTIWVGQEQETRIRAILSKESGNDKPLFPRAKLRGSEKQIDWAERIRNGVLYAFELIDDAELCDRARNKTRSAFEQNSHHHRLEIIEALSCIDSASWWIENRGRSLSAYLRAAVELGRKARQVSPPPYDAAAAAVLAAATLAPPKVFGPIAEVSIDGCSVRVVLSEFDQDGNAFLKAHGARWDDPAWRRDVEEGVAPQHAVEIAIALLSKGYPVRIFDEALRKRVVDHDYDPVPPRRVEVAHHEKHGTKFRLAWAFDSNPWECERLANKLRGAKVFGDAAHVAASHYEDIEDFARQHGFVITAAARALIDAERAKILKAERVTPHPKIAPVTITQAERQPLTGEIDAELADID